MSLARVPSKRELAQVSQVRRRLQSVAGAGGAVSTVAAPGPLEHAPMTSAIAAHHPMPIRLSTLLPAMRRLVVEPGAQRP